MSNLIQPVVQHAKWVVVFILSAVLIGWFQESIFGGLSNYVQNYFDALQTIVDQGYFAC